MNKRYEIKNGLWKIAQETPERSTFEVLESDTFGEDKKFMPTGGGNDTYIHLLNYEQAKKAMEYVYGSDFKFTESPFLTQLKSMLNIVGYLDYDFSDNVEAIVGDLNEVRNFNIRQLELMKRKANPPEENTQQPNAQTQSVAPAGPGRGSRSSEQAAAPAAPVAPAAPAKGGRAGGQASAPVAPAAPTRGGRAGGQASAPVAPAAPARGSRSRT